jgi:glucosylceramidase
MSLPRRLALALLVIVALWPCALAAARAGDPRQPLVAVVETTANLARALTNLPDVRFSTGTPVAKAPTIRVNVKRRFQRFIGAGGALTDSSAWLIYDELPPAARSVVMAKLFSSSGIDLRFLRVPIGASDFTATGIPYTYDDLRAGASDPTLAHFSIAHDDVYVLPLLRAALSLNRSLFLEAAPWTPPAWMKANGALNNLGDAGTLLASAYGPLAGYLVKFLQAYAAQGVPIDALAPANEPGVGSAYPGMQLSPAEEAHFIDAYLRPALSAAGLNPALYGWDLSWAPLRAHNPLIAGARVGIAWHCYKGGIGMMSALHRLARTASQIVDECTTGSGDIFPTAELLIASLRNWASAVALFNLALDPQGGPVEPPNSGCLECTGILTVNVTTGAVSYSADYYELGQLTRYVEPGAVRIATNNFVSYGLGPYDSTTITRGLDDVAFANPDGSKVLIAYNNARHPVTFNIEWRGAYVYRTLPAGATVTLRWR